MIKALFTTVSRSFISLAGVVLATSSAFLFLTLLLIEELGHGLGGYSGIIAFLIIPGIFLLGLGLIPLGLWKRRRADRALAREGQAASAPVVDFNVAHTRNVAVMVVLLTMVNFAILATGTYKGVETMESTDFCGGTCHSVMGPEFSAYKRSPHAQVHCTQCHIGPGAGSFVKAKVQGSWQLISVTMDLYPRPIPAPVESLRPANETCERCHTASRFVGDRLKVISRFAEDEANTEKQTVLMTKVGGPVAGRTGGAHWHVDPAHTVRFRSDRRRLYVSQLELSLADGGVEAFSNATPTDAGLTEGWRTMDCLDCHNRPAHTYQRPKDEVDLALATGALDKSLPYLRREGLRIIQGTYASAAEAKTGIRKELFDFYTKEYPELLKSEPQKLEAAAATLHDLYTRNVFPEMKIAWGTYPSFHDHADDSGCFRCHSNDMKSATGRKVSQKCDLCHTTLAEEEEHPEIVEQLSGE